MSYWPTVSEDRPTGRIRIRFGFLWRIAVEVEVEREFLHVSPGVGGRAGPETVFRRHVWRPARRGEAGGEYVSATPRPAGSAAIPAHALRGVVQTAAAGGLGRRADAHLDPPPSQPPRPKRCTDCHRTEAEAHERWCPHA